MAQGRDQPLPRHLLEPPELRQRADEHQEEEGHKVFITQQPASANDSLGWISGFSRMTGDQAAGI